jgi:DNA replication and repair protein RecF
MNVIYGIILQNFRNYSFRQFEFSPKINFFVGKNGSGKTNLLEAISLLGTSNGIKKAEIKHLNSNFITPFSIGLDTSYGNIGIKNHNGTKKFFLEDEQIKFITLEKQFNIIAMLPEDEFIFKSSTSERRKFFDNLISKVLPSHAELLKDYKNLCTQRAKILNNFDNQNSWLSTIEKQIAQKLIIITSNRVLISEKLSNIMQSLKNTNLHGSIILSGQLENKIQNNNFISLVEENLLAKELEMARSVDAITGKTLTKFEKTNFDILFKLKNMKATQSSAGEQKQMLFSFFLSIVKSSKSAIILIDEVMDKLDLENKKIIFSEIESTKGQFFLTGTEKFHSKSCNFIFI